jgi:hypothetical protein
MVTLFFADGTLMENDILTFIKHCIRHGRILWTYHVNMRLEGRFISRKSIISSVDTLEVIEEYPNDKYLPSYLIYAQSESEVIHIHIGVDKKEDNVRIITAYRPTSGKWHEDFKTRREQ